MFEEKANLEGQAVPFNGECISGDAIGDTNSKRVLIASRHLRNDSKSIQLEYRYDDDTVRHQYQRPRKHIRSNSCDIKIQRSNSATNRESDFHDWKLKRFMRHHTRNNSRDLDQEHCCRQQQQLQQQQSGGSQLGRWIALHNNEQPTSNIKYILNHLKNNNVDGHSKLNYSNSCSNGAGCGGIKKKRHTRNYSYGQEFSFLPNNVIIRLDNDIANKFLANNGGASTSRKSSFSHDVNLLKNVNKLNNCSTGVVIGGGVAKNTNDLNEELESKYAKGSSHSYGHSRNNSKDLNLLNLQEEESTASGSGILGGIKALIDDSNSILRHRRTNSKDLKYIGGYQPCEPISSASSCSVSSNNIRKLSGGHLHPLALTTTAASGPTESLQLLLDKSSLLDEQSADSSTNGGGGSTSTNV